MFWFMAFVLAGGASFFFISNLFIKFDVMPVIMSLTPQSYTIKDIPFPSITICNMNSMRKTEAERILNSNLEEHDVDQKLIHDFCDTSNITQTPEDQNITADWEYIKKFMVKMSQPCHEMLGLCMWHDEPLSCTNLFNPSLTDEGMCCVFNRLNRDLIFQNPQDVSDLNVTFPIDSVDWSPQRGYPENAPPDNLPRRVRGSGRHLGLTVVVDSEIDEYFCSSENGKGFKVLLNNPIETPKVSSFGISVAPGYETKMVIIPHIMTATPQLVNVDLSKRQCFFENERQLLFYRTYTQRGCTLECEANFTLAFCGCVQYFMPKNKETRICGRIDRKCAIDAQRMMELSMNEAILNFTFNTNKKLDLCNCLPGCHEMSFGFVISSAPITDHLTLKPNFLGDKDYKYFKENKAIIHFFFMEKHFSGTVRGVLFGITELLCKYRLKKKNT
nr:pickpocket protein 28-like isoform X1 [Halyomorpha halys]